MEALASCSALGPVGLPTKVVSLLLDQVVLIGTKGYRTRVSDLFIRLASLESMIHTKDNLAYPVDIGYQFWTPSRRPTTVGISGNNDTLVTY